MVLVAGAVVGIGIRQVHLERAAVRREARWTFGAGPSGMIGQRGFWTGLTRTDSVSCQQEIEALVGVLEVIPDYAPAQRALSLAYAYAGSSSQAIRSAERYADLEPRDLDLPLLLASVYSLAGRYDEALDILGRVEDPDTLVSWFEKMQGDILVAKGMCGQAGKAYQRFISCARYDGVRADGYFLLGRVRIQQGRYADALESFDQCGYPGSSDVRTRVGRGLTFARQGLVERARAEAGRIDSSAANGDAASFDLYLLMMGRILMAEKRWEAAILTLREGVERTQFPERLRYMTALAKAYGLAGEFEQARETLNCCLAVNSACAEARYLSARIYENQDLPDHALAEYEIFLDTWRDADPDLPMLVDAQRRVEGIRTSP